MEANGEATPLIAGVKTNLPKTRGALSASKRWITVEPVVMTAAFGYGILLVVISQYLHKHFIDLYVHNTTLKNFSLCDANASEEQMNINDKVQAQTSLWTTYLTSSMAVTSLPVSTLLGSLSDQIGRKIPIALPLVGLFLCCCCSVITIYFGLPIYLFLVGTGLLGLSGGFMLLVTVSYAYIADITTEENRMFRIVVIEVLLFLMAGFPQIAIGYVITHMGFSVPFIVGAAMTLIGLAYVMIPGCLKETVEFNREDTKRPIKTAVRDIIKVFKVSENNRRWIITFYFLVIFVMVGLGTGSISVTSIYAMGRPFCLLPEEIGFFIFASLMSTGLGCMIGGAVFPLCFGPFTMMYMSFFSAQVGFVATALVTTKPWLYVAICLSFLKLLAVPVSRTALSNIVTPMEQGTIFALIGIMDNVATFIFPVFLQAIYTATVSFHQFLFYMAAGLIVIPTVLTMFIHVLQQRYPTNNISVDPSSTEGVAIMLQCMMRRRDKDSMLVTDSGDIQ